MIIQRFHLKNGMPLFVVENHASPVVSIQAWVSRGSVYESPKLAGISHFLEHALFKGTQKRKVGEIALEIEKRGGEINAFTSYEETCYYCTLASRYVEEGIDIITDAIQNPAFDKQEMLREREVILEEIKRAQDSPHKVLVTNLWKGAFPGTPYGRPVLGFTETVSKIDHLTLRKYFNANYHAGTVCYIVVGDIEPAQVKKMIDHKTRQMRKKPTYKIRFAPPKTRNVPHLLTSARDVQECFGQIGWVVPNIKHPLLPAIDLLCTALGQGESSRFYQTLVKEKKVALQANMGLAATAKCGLATVGLETVPENLEAALRETVALLRSAAENGLFEKEIERVKSALEAEVIAGKETVEGYARRLGYYYVQFGDPEYEKQYLDALLSTPRSTAQEAISYLLKQKPVLSLVHPKDFTLNKQALVSSLNQKSQSFGKKIRVSPSVKMKMHGTIRLIEKQLTDLPITSLKIVFPGGSREEKPGELGLGNLFQRTWGSGTRSFSSLEIAHRLESLGASVNTFCGKHTLGISADFLSKHWPLVKPILQEILANPTFAEDELITERELLLRDIISEKDTPGAVCQLNFMQTLYGTHPYGRSPNGCKEDVEKIQQHHLKDFYSRFVHRKSAIVSTVGNFDCADWEAEMTELLNLLPASGALPQPTVPIAEKDRLKVSLAQKDPLFQSHVMIGFLSTSLQDHERYGLKLLASALSGQGGRLFLELRDKQSLAYQLAPIHSETPDRGFFGFYIGCSPEKLTRSIAGIRGELNKILHHTIASKELCRAKEYWIGRFELDLQRYSSQAMLFALDEMYGLGYNHYLNAIRIVKEITAEDIQHAAQKYLKCDLATISVVHREKLTEEEVVAAWEGRSTIQKSSKNSRREYAATAR